MYDTWCKCPEGGSIAQQIVAAHRSSSLPAVQMGEGAKRRSQPCISVDLFVLICVHQAHMDSNVKQM